MMRRLKIFALLMIGSGAVAHAANYPISAGASTATMQSTINAAAAAGGGNTVTFAAGPYSITSQINIPCPASALTIQGPTPAGVGTTWPVTPTAILTSTLGEGTALVEPTAGNIGGSTRVNRAQTLAWAAGDDVALKVTVTGSACTNEFVVTAQYQEPPTP